MPVPPESLPGSHSRHGQPSAGLCWVSVAPCPTPTCCRPGRDYLTCLLPPPLPLLPASLHSPFLGKHTELSGAVVQEDALGRCEVVILEQPWAEHLELLSARSPQATLFPLLPLSSTTRFSRPNTLTCPRPFWHSGMSSANKVMHTLFGEKHILLCLTFGKPISQQLMEDPA